VEWSRGPLPSDLGPASCFIKLDDRTASRVPVGLWGFVFGYAVPNLSSIAEIMLEGSVHAAIDNLFYRRMELGISWILVVQLPSRQPERCRARYVKAYRPKVIESVG